jgi:hypothetical protein
LTANTIQTLEFFINLHTPASACLKALRLIPKSITMKNENLAVLEKWFEGFNSKNLELLLSLYHENAQHFSPKLKIRQPETNGLIKGKDQLRAWWKDAFERLPKLHYQPNYSIADDNSVFVEYVRTVPGEEEMIVGEVLFFENGLIVKSKVFHS